VSAAVWVGGDGNQPLHDAKNKPIYGSTIAGPTWQNFLNLYLKGKPAEKFGKVAPIGKDVNDVTTTQAKPSETPSSPPPPSTSETPPSTESSETSSETTPRTTRTGRPGPGGSTPPIDPASGNTFGGGDGLAAPPGAGPG
jgi:membrane carboxypeptidase/penicillin-binding protein